mmetsp:Transcript_1290/g.3160  ORF Transcript_1290/g.3160 Transcript_1290/m.3160 type:complete len:245 (+) Transcript_1290:442-1176(+)
MRAPASKASTDLKFRRPPGPFSKPPQTNSRPSNSAATGLARAEFKGGPTCQMPISGSNTSMELLTGFMPPQTTSRPANVAAAAPLRASRMSGSRSQMPRTRSSRSTDAVSLSDPWTPPHMYTCPPRAAPAAQRRPSDMEGASVHSPVRTSKISTEDLQLPAGPLPPQTYSRACWPLISACEAANSAGEAVRRARLAGSCRKGATTALRSRSWKNCTSTDIKPRRKEGLPTTVPRTPANCAAGTP